jgi:hypothetical protein
MDTQCDDIIIDGSKAGKTLAPALLQMDDSRTTPAKSMHHI